MNYNNRVLHFMLLIFTVLLLFSVFIKVNHINKPYLQNISIISSLFKKDTVSAIASTHQKTVVVKQNKVDSAGVKDSTIAVNNNIHPLHHFLKQLQALQNGQRRQVRIAYLGDSMIEGDLITETFRRLLQQKFGGYGVGFVPVTSIVAGFRNTVKHSFSGNWVESNFRQKISAQPLYLSGKVFYPNGYNWVQWQDNTVAQKPLCKYLLTGYKPNTASLTINQAYNNFTPQQLFNRVFIDSSSNNLLKLETSDKVLPIYGASFESSTGVIVDNFSFRGSSGFELLKADNNFMQAIQQSQPYDLVVLQYGVNLLGNANTKQFDWYEKAMTTCILQLKQQLAGASFLLVGAADKAHKYYDGVYTAIGLPNLLTTQQKIATATHCSFFNTYEAMGGYNSIIKWANEKPQALAAKDYTHLSFKGANIIGTKLYETLYQYFLQMPKP